MQNTINIDTKKWGKNIGDSEGVIKECRGKIYKYVAYTTHNGLDLCAGGKTVAEAHNKLLDYITNSILVKH